MPGTMDQLYLSLVGLHWRHPSGALAPAVTTLPAMRQQVVPVTVHLVVLVAGAQAPQPAGFLAPFCTQTPLITHTVDSGVHAVVLFLGAQEAQPVGSLAPDW